MTKIKDTVERLADQVEQLSNELAEKAKIAVITDVESGADIVQQAQGLIEIREQYRLKKMALSEAKDRLKLESDASVKAWRDAQRDKCCELTDQIEKKGNTLALAIKRAAKHYGDIVDLERDLRITSGKASDWPSPDWTRTRAPGELPYELLIGVICTNYDLPTAPPPFWPKSDSAQRSADVSHVFRSLIQLRDAWQNPETDESENDADDTGDWREASAEDLNHVA
jgi:hypothetical protein